MSESKDLNQELEELLDAELTEEEIAAILMYVSKGVTSDRSKQLEKDFQKIKDMIKEAKEERIKGLHGKQCED